MALRFERSPSRIIVLLFAFTFALGLATPAAAALVEVTPPYNVASNPLYIYTMTDDDPAIAHDDAGNLVETWYRYTLGEDNGVYMRLFGPDGQPKGPEVQISTNTYVESQAPVAMDSAGNFVVVHVAANSKYGYLLMQRFDKDGKALGSELRVDDIKYPRSALILGFSMAMNRSGQFVVSWYVLTFAKSPSGSESYWQTQVFMRLYAADGTPTTNVLKAVTDPVVHVTPDMSIAAQTENPGVAIDDAGNVVLAWNDYFCRPAHDVRIQRFDKTGKPIGSPIVVPSPEGTEPRMPSLAGNSNGDFVVGWMSYVPYAASGGYTLLARYAADGTPIGGVQQVAAPSGSSLDATPVGPPALTMNASGSAVAFFTECRVSTDVDCLPVVQFINTDGVLSEGSYFASPNEFDYFTIAATLNDVGILTLTWPNGDGNLVGAQFADR